MKLNLEEYKDLNIKDFWNKILDTILCHPDELYNMKELIKDNPELTDLFKSKGLPVEEVIIDYKRMGPVDIVFIKDADDIKTELEARDAYLKTLKKEEENEIKK